MWSGRRIVSTIAAGGLLLELGWAIVDQIHLRAVARGNGLFGQLRELGRL